MWYNIYVRIIAGRFGGHHLDVPKSCARPTTDRVKESLFSMLEVRDFVKDANVLDLFGGSGALSFEALSRGAKSATIVEIASEGVNIIRKNASKLKVNVDVIKGNSKSPSTLKKLNQTFDLVFIDPPYAFTDDDVQMILTIIIEGRLIDDGVVVLESAILRPVPKDWEEITSKTYGNTVVQILCHIGARGVQ
ncbi:RNA methyltransferase [Actinomycetota bacterium]|nr:RNA methyltransferase [Actinomycetota bacterium]